MITGCKKDSPTSAVINSGDYIADMNVSPDFNWKTDMNVIIDVDLNIDGTVYVLSTESDDIVYLVASSVNKQLNAKINVNNSVTELKIRFNGEDKVLSIENETVSCSFANTTKSAMADSDGDGVDDLDDDYPADITRAYDNFWPASNYGTLAFEDMWPHEGDFDYNDLVVGFQYQTVTNGSNQVVEIFCYFDVRAIGGMYRNGFGVQFADIDPTDVTSVAGYDMGVSENYVSLHANGYEDGHTGELVVLAFEDAWEILVKGDTTFGVNVEPLQNDPVESDTITVTITMANTNYTYPGNFDAEDSNPFILANINVYDPTDANLRREIHLKDEAPTDLMVTDTLFGDFHDTSVVANGEYYYSIAYHAPWALMMHDVVLDFDWTIEGDSSIARGYLKFTSWANSDGLSDTDWWSGTGGLYRDEAYIW
jgi:LruC domain-containing protein